MGLAAGRAYYECPPYPRPVSPRVPPVYSVVRSVASILARYVRGGCEEVLCAIVGHILFNIRYENDFCSQLRLNDHLEFWKNDYRTLVLSGRMKIKFVSIFSFVLLLESSSVLSPIVSSESSLDWPGLTRYQ